MVTIKQHYISKFIIDNFKNNNELLIYDKLSKKSKIVSSKNFASEKFFYEIKDKNGELYMINIIEQKLNKIETLASKYIKEIISSDPAMNSTIDCHICFILEKFMFYQLFRGKDIMNKIINEFKDDNESINATKALLFLSELQREDYFIYNNYIDENNTLEDFNCIDNIDRIYEKNKKLNTLNVLVAPKNKTFILGNNPIVHTYKSIAKLVFPISPKMVLCFSDYKTAIKYGYINSFIRIKPEFVDKINKQTRKQSDKYIIPNKKTD